MTGIVPCDCDGTRAWMPGSTCGGCKVPRCSDSLSLSVVLPPVPSGGAIFSGGGCEALGGAIGGGVTCGDAGCGFCAPATHGKAMQARALSSSVIRLVI